MVGSLSFGLFYEFLSCLRRTWLRPAPWRVAHPLLWRCGMAAFFTLQLACGYTLMLIAMTYQVELFAATVFGIGIGHFAFNVTSPDSASTDPCCPDNEPSGKRKLGALEAPLLPSPARKGSSEGVSVSVDGMVCEHCVASVDAALKAVAGVTEVSVDLEAGLARVHGEAAVDALLSAVNAAGFRATPLDGARSAYEAPRLAARKSYEKAEKEWSTGTRLADGALQTWLTVEGMTCNGCRARVEKALNDLGAIVSVYVDLHSALTRVRHQPSLTVAQMIAAVEQLGYRPSVSAAEAVQAYQHASQAESQMSSPSDHVLSLEIDGMHCAACASKVEAVLTDLDGVRHASVSILAKSAKVMFEPRRTGVRAISLAIESLGYRAVVHSGTAENTALVTQGMSEEVRSWRGRFVGSLGWTLPIMTLSMVLPMTPLAPHLTTPVVRGMSVRVALLWLLATVVQFAYGARFYRSAWAGLRHCVTNMDTLVALGTSIAYGYSVLTVVSGQRSSHRSHVFVL